MSVAAARRLAVGYFVLYAVAVTYPGIVPFSRITPRILGLPFSLVWVTSWVIGAGLVLWGLHHAETRGRTEA